MKRGRSKSLASLARYRKGGVVTKQHLKLDQKLRGHLGLCAQHIEQVMLGKQAVVRFQ